MADMTTVVGLLSATEGLRRRMLTLYVPTAVACPRCNAAPGHECRSRNGNRPLSYHVPRYKLLEQMDSDDARLRLLLKIYEQLAADTPKGSVWAGRAQVLRQLLDTPEDTR